MSVRVHELAKHCGLTNKEMIAKLRAMNYPVKTHSSTVDKITAEAIENEYGYVPPSATPPPPPAPATPPPAAPEPQAAAAAPAPPAEPAPPPTVPQTPAAPAPPPVPAPQTAPAAPPPVAPPAAPPAAATPPAVAEPVSAPERPAPPAAKPPPPLPPPPPPPRMTPPPRPAPPSPPAEPAYTIDEQGRKIIHMKPPVVVRDLAHRIGTKPHLLLMELMELNVFANLNETITEDIARKVCERHDFLFELEKRERGGGTVHAPPKKVEVLELGEEPEDLRPRSPVVTFLGHVDHGKTSLLDAIRQTDVVAGEAGGITQHIGASVVRLPDGRSITFLDTPGHEAFTKMRARGANVTDIAVLVVAADDGVMPQTIEAINHAKAAKVPVMVAINKCDLPAANPDRVRKQLQEHGLAPESWGGETITVEVSATTKKGIDSLLEMILLQAEVLELQASPKVPARGHVIEAQIEPGMGSTATVLVSKGTLRVGDSIICGPHWAKIRALLNDQGKRVKEAPPATPVKIVGLSGAPEAGAEFTVMPSDREARQLSEQRLQEVRLAGGAPAAARVRLEDILSQGPAEEKKVLRAVLKADVQGSLEALGESLGKLKSDKVELELIHGAIGNVNENDVLLASASNAIILGFRVKLESGVSDLAKREAVQIKLYSIIYELIEQVEEAMQGLIEPEAREIQIGQAQVKQVFELTKGAKVAGCVVTNGRITRGARARVVRRRAVQYEGRLASLRHFQDDVREVKSGMECGLRLENFSDFQEGDVLEFFTVEKVTAKL